MSEIKEPTSGNPIMTTIKTITKPLREGMGKEVMVLHIFIKWWEEKGVVNGLLNRM